MIFPEIVCHFFRSALYTASHRHLDGGNEATDGLLEGHGKCARMLRGLI